MAGTHEVCRRQPRSVVSEYSAVPSVRRCVAIPPEQWNQPIPGGFNEYGYIQNEKEGLRQHKNHDSSNYLMNLFDAICRLHMPQYKLFQIPIYNITFKE
ncbi:hypothetical protein BAUCODRAFT_140140, partial [Baudoinia panamericana UAMH 10762]